MFVPRSYVRIFCNERTRSTPFVPKLTFGAFRTIRAHLGPFCCLTNFVAKQAEVVQKFVQQSRVRIFYNERTRSTPLDPKLTFYCIFYTIWVHSGPFGCLTKLGGKRAELVQKFVPRSCVRIFHNERTDPPGLNENWCFGAFRTIWVYSRPFGCLTKLGAKRTELVEMFVPRSRVRIFRNERTRSTPLDPNMSF